MKSLLDWWRGESWMRAAVAAWCILLGVTLIKPLVRPVSGTIYPTYAKAGEEFAAERRLYDVPHPHTDNFRYSPLVAAAFAPFSWLPLGVGGWLWRIVSDAVFLTGVAAWMRRVCPHVPKGLYWLLAIPLAIGSLNNGQANTIVAGFLLWGTCLASNGRWAVSAVLVAAATLFKIYPVAFAALLGLLAPIRFGVPFALAIGAGLALPFAFASPDYVADQYRFWLANLGADDRSHFAPHAGLQDVQMLLRVFGTPLPLSEYRYLQVAAGGAVAVIVLWLRWSGRTKSETVLAAFSLYACWVLTFGPAVETSTYVLMAPLFARELLDRRGQPRWALRAAVVGAAILVSIRIALALPRVVHQPYIALGVYPIGTLLLAGAIVGRILHREPPIAATAAERAPFKHAA